LSPNIPRLYHMKYILYHMNNTIHQYNDWSNIYFTILFFYLCLQISFYQSQLSYPLFLDSN
jgi:branched-subunit amino acid permease